eukprot:4493556-Ditylum_brightwellii.AAC.1
MITKPYGDPYEIKNQLQILNGVIPATTSPTTMTTGRRTRDLRILMKNSGDFTVNVRVGAKNVNTFECFMRSSGGDAECFSAALVVGKICISRLAY